MEPASQHYNAWRGNIQGLAWGHAPLGYVLSAKKFDSPTLKIEKSNWVGGRYAAHEIVNIGC